MHPFRQSETAAKYMKSMAQTSMFCGRNAPLLVDFSH
jgi:hypothetical protein